MEGRNRLWEPLCVTTKRERERQICDLIDEGANDDAIAKFVGVSRARVTEVRAAYERSLDATPVRPQPTQERKGRRMQVVVPSTPTTRARRLWIDVFDDAARGR